MSRTERFFVGLDLSLKRKNRAAFDDIVGRNCINKIIGEKFAFNQYRNREDWKESLLGFSKTTHLIFIWGGPVRSLQSVYFLNGLASKKNISVVLLHSEEPPTVYSEILNNKILPVNYWQYLNGSIEDFEYLELLGQALNEAVTRQ